MLKKVNKVLLFTFNVIIFFLISLLHYSNFLNINYFGAGTTLLIPLLVSFSLWNSPLAAALAGALSGMIMDSCAHNSYCFNTILLLLIGVFVSVTSNTLFNKNLPSAIVISLICSVVYYLLKWAIFHTFSEGVTNSLLFLLQISLPSAILTSLFIFPFYYLYKYIEKLKS